MQPTSSDIRYRRLHAPREDRSTLVEPAWDDVPALVESNRRLAAERHYDVQGRTLAQLTLQARTEMLRDAVRWTSAYRDVAPLPAGAEALVFMAGHQPQLFHPGVWFKNFALDYVARRHGAVAVNLIVDSDTAKSSTARVPGGTADQPSAASLAYDEPGPALPYEERRIRQRSVFADFGRCAMEQLGTLVRDPLVREYWPMAVERARRTDNLGACLAQSRHQLEARWGLSTLEVPQSRVCMSQSFMWLAAHLLAQLPRFHAVYNGALQEYRRVHGIRNGAHPVPDLAADGPWLETPLWIWTAENPVRRPLFAAQEGAQVVLSDRQSLRFVLPLTPEADARRAVQILMELSCRGVKIRSRALLTTLWARMVLGDLFVHGIGGAKYDQVTDVIVQRFFGSAPPGYMVLSATLHLPIERQDEDLPSEAAVQRQLRDLDFHAEHALAAEVSAEATALAAEKRRWIATPMTPSNAHERHLAIRRVNAALQPWVAQRRRELLDLLPRAKRAAQVAEVLSWREYAFCLYPTETLREFLVGSLPPG